ncbi:MAG: malto-oligosyltrehalose trehalohydrolase [Planctomycetaceae bacterium]|nr:malto-oligosyltrehalose trehalohydrolase [Planctomycetaceae bacterium]
MSWRASLGARPDADAGGVWFRVWAPDWTCVEVVLEGPGARPRAIALEKHPDGTFGGLVPGLGAGARYRYRVDGLGPFPDPASRYQPEGVHGPSQVVDPDAFAWTDASWRGVDPAELILYELHVGTFSPEGTFEGATRLLPRVAELGATAIELMPLADFPGRRNWGYDGVDLFAPARCYGTPDDLRRLVDEAHRLGLAVLLDVVYNHLGPDGNYLAQFSPSYFSSRHKTPWGPAINLDGPRSAMVRAFFIENALCWLHEYHMDGLRLDATHYLFDEGPRPFLAELAATSRRSVPDRPVHLIAEDPRNLAAMVRTESEGGWGLDALWSDDFHHELRRYLAGDCEGAFRDFRGLVADLVRTINRGWLFTGEFSTYRGYHRGTDPAGLAPRRFVFYIQNHDRIGNRALGERLNHQVDPATYRAATALLLTTAATPLLFMGQEWASGAPFLFFTDHDEGLGRLVREGRRHEFRHFAAFTDPAQRDRIPDCQAESTFLACKLDWSGRDREPHRSTLRLYQALIHLRRTEPALRSSRPGSFEATALDDDSLHLRRDAEDGGSSLQVVVRLRGAGTVSLGSLPDAAGRRWEVVLTTEDPPFAPDPSPPRVDLAGPAPILDFDRPGAILLREHPDPGLGGEIP